MLKMESYSHCLEPPELIQTHISYVILVDNYVYKWKKPVDFGFLDFSTLQLRKFYCDEELRLNRRLCPGIYLDRVQISLLGSGFALDTPGKVIDYGIKMKRMPADKMMDHLLVTEQLTKADIQKIVLKLVPFYEKAAGGATVEHYGQVEKVANNINNNFVLTDQFVGNAALSQSRFKTIQQYALKFMKNEPVFNRRIEAGKIRECHGDLHSANICLAEDTFIFDCIEFNKALRCTDIAADVAFLAMDLDFHGRKDLSSFFINRYMASSGDDELLEVLNFYKCYRAYVRGKIGLLTGADPTVKQQDRILAARKAGEYFSLAEQYSLADW